MNKWSIRLESVLVAGFLVFIVVLFGSIPFWAD